MATTINYANKRVAYLHMAALIGNAADKLRECADDSLIIELALVDSNAAAFRAMADTLRQEAGNWNAIHAAITTMDTDRPFAKKEDPDAKNL